MRIARPCSPLRKREIPSFFLRLASRILDPTVKRWNRTRKLELRRHGAYARRVILRSSPFLLADNEGSPPFASHVRWLALQTNCRDSSPRQVGTQNNTGSAFSWRCGLLDTSVGFG